MSVYGYDNGKNLVEVANKGEFDSLALEVDFKQNNLSATNGQLQSDCHEITQTGYYYISAQTSNGPGVNGVLSCVRLNESGSVIVHEVINTDATIKYTEVYANGVWTEWHPNYYNMDSIIEMLNANIEQNAGNISDLQLLMERKQDIEDETLATDDKTIPGAINELSVKMSIAETDIANKQSKIDQSLETESKNVILAINEVNAKIITRQITVTANSASQYRDKWYGTSGFDTPEGYTPVMWCIRSCTGNHPATCQPSDSNNIRVFTTDQNDVVIVDVMYIKN